MQVLDSQLVPAPWDLLISVPLALAGDPPAAASVAHSLEHLTRHHLSRGDRPRAFSPPELWKQRWLEIVLIGCELAVTLGVEHNIILPVVQELRAEFGSDLAFTSPAAIDRLLRTWLLEQHLSRTDSSLDALLKLLQLNHEQGGPASRPARGSYEDAQRREELTDIIRVLFPVYAGRLGLLTAGNEQPTGPDRLAQQLPGLRSEYSRIDYSHRFSGLRPCVARTVMQLMILPGIPVDLLLQHATDMLTERDGTGPGTDLVPLLQYALLRRGAHGLVIDVVAKQCQLIREAHWASSDKVERLISLSRLLMRVSSEDAKVLFVMASELTSEMDREVFDQIETLAHMATSASELSTEVRRDTAVELFRFVSGAAERLSSYGDFPCQAAVTAMARLSVPLALAAVARWTDGGAADLEETLQPLLRAGLDLRELSPELAIALAMLLETPDESLPSRILGARQGTNPSLAEELARDCLLHVPQQARLDFAREVLAGVGAPSSAASAEVHDLQALVDFLDRLGDAHGTAPDERLQRPAHGVQWIDDLAATRFTSPESISGALKMLREAGSYSDSQSLIEMAKRTRGSDRVDYLRALAALDPTTVWAPDLARAVVSALDTWKGTPAVEAWRSQELPAFLIHWFHFLARGIKEGYSCLADLLAAMPSSPTDRLQVISQALESSGLSLGSRDLYGVAERMLGDTPPAASATLLTWYTERLAQRLPQDSATTINPNDVPDAVTAAAARFLFALLGDIDTRVRWRAAHVLRRLARLGTTIVLNAVVANWDRTDDLSFRAPDAPYYWLAARLWLMIALDRIAGEVPTAVMPHVETLARIVSDATLPHLLIREYAKRAILRLQANGHSHAGIDLETVAKVNTPLLARRRSRRPAARTRPADVNRGRAFDFDIMDTVPYWYEPIVDLFRGLRMDQFLDRAEHWIQSEWNARPNAHWWALEPRKGRYDERRFGSWSHRHGSLPIVERYGTYLEWHAMMCVVGDLLQTHAIAMPDDDDEGFDGWLATFLPTNSDYWLSDLRQPVPLEERFWARDSRADDAWLGQAHRRESAAEVGIGRAGRPDWIVVAAYYTAQWPTRKREVRITSALVSPATAGSLRRALETVSDPWDYRLPNEGDDMEIDADPYRLIGWLEDKHVEMQFDTNDPLRHQARPPNDLPGRRVTRLFNLTQQPGPRLNWAAEPGNRSCIIAEVWSDFPERDDDRRPRPTGSNGWRLWIRRANLQAFLIDQGMDLLCEVQLERRVFDPYSSRFDRDRDKKTRRLDHVLLLRGDGQLEAATGRSGTWTTARGRARA
jgi:hypothetical protein